MLIIVSVLAALVARVFFVSVYKVSTQTMAPVFLAGDYVLASQVSYGFKFPINNESYFKSSPAVGDLVVYTSAGKTYIKRVMAKAGSEIEYFHSKLSINSIQCEYLNAKQRPSGTHETLDEKCGNLIHPVLRALDSASATIVPKTLLNEGQFLAIADNRSPDSNGVSAELVNYDQIVGKPILIWMSYTSTQDFISEANGFRWNRILTIPQ